MKISVVVANFMQRCYNEHYKLMNEDYYDKRIDS